MSNDTTEPSNGKAMGYMPNCETFRQYAGLTKSALAAAAKISRETVSKVEHRQKVSLEKLHAIARVLEETCKRPFVREDEIRSSPTAPRKR